jgi:hypothetical protein
VVAHGGRSAVAAVGHDVQALFRRNHD